MNFFQLHIIIIAVLTAVTTSLPGVFLVLRGVALMSDAISHAILLGIICMFLVVKELHSFWLLIGASCAGILTVICTEALISTERIKKDAAIGLVFPLFFAVAIILISLFARNVHLDTDMVLLGEIAFAPFNRMILFGNDYGPYALWLLSVLALLNAAFITFFYKELKLATFDPTIAKLAGFSPTLLYYGLMSITSVTAVGVFDTVGAIVFVALTIVPATTAYLWTSQLHKMITITLMCASSSAVSGYFMAWYLDVSIAGCIAVMCGFLFLVSLLFASRKGLIARKIFLSQSRISLTLDLMCGYIKNQKTGLIEKNMIAQLYAIPTKRVDLSLQLGVKKGLITLHESGKVLLTQKGYLYAESIK